MTLSDRPTIVARWETGLTPEVLQAIGKLAVVSAQIEQYLHQIYWKHAGLNNNSGPVVTDNLNPKRLSEDILKLVGFDAAKANIADDLEILFAEFQTLNTQRNQCLHWIWSIVGQEVPNSPDGVGQGAQKPPFRLLKPVYKQKGIESVEFHAEDVQKLTDDGSWL